MAQSDEKDLLSFLEKGALVYVLCLMAFTYFWKTSRELTFGILIGGMLALANFRLWRRFARKLFEEKERDKSWILRQIALKGLFPLVTIPLVAWLLHVHAIGFILGLSAIVFSILLYAGWLISKSLGEKPDES